ISSPLSVGVPGLVRMLADLHKREGRLPWSDLFAPAITLATEGFEISPRLHGLLTWMRADRFSDDRARTYFFEADGSPKPVGTRLTNLAFAATLSDLAKGGAQAFYGGTISAKIIERLRDNPAAAVTTHARAVLAQSDFVAYRSVERPPVCTTYRGYRVCGMGPPSSGAITVAQTLALIEPYAIGRSRGDALRPAAVHIIAEAQKLAFADRGRYLADPDHVRVPMTLLDRAYLANRSKLIHPGRAATSVKPGIPPGVNPRTRGADGSVESAGTSHISIVDADGNAVSLTSSIESAFGNRTMVGGFLLNNQLTDFSFRPIDADGQPIANRVGPGKRPRSSMAPTVIFAPDGNLFAVLGSPGGSRIILYVTKAIVSLIDWQLDAQEAAALTNFGSRGRGFEIESAPTPDRLRALYKAFADRLFADQSAPSPIPIIRPLDMKAYNHELRPARMTSGLQIIVRRSEGLEGGSDPRREGVSRGR
ncbi:MAG: gamma-glutamyltransferase family protein, partial [Pseudomonadota bacterium]